MIQIVFNFLFRFFGIFLDSYWWTRPPDPPPLVSKMYKQIFLTNLDNKINLTPKKMYNVLAAAQGTVAAVQVCMS